MELSFWWVVGFIVTLVLVRMNREKLGSEFDAQDFSNTIGLLLLLAAFWPFILVFVLYQSIR